jgi:GNAT superfamily N-acetyltransferase
VYFRQATRDDVDLLADLGRRTFYDTFAADNTPTDMAQYLATAFSQETIQAELLTLESVFLLAYPDATLESQSVGYARLQGNSRPPGNPDWPSPLELGRLYVEQSVLGQGYGSALMQACLDYALEAGFQTLWLGVWERNYRALRFYQKWRFHQTGTQTFTLGQDIQTDLVMMRPVTLTIDG